MRRRALVFALLYAGVIAYLSLFPARVLDAPKAPSIVWAAMSSRRQVLDFGLNVLLYVPLGFALSLRLGVGWLVTATAALAGLLVSASMETLQLWIPARFSTYNDLLSNTLGTLAGAILAQTLRGQAVVARLKPSAIWGFTPIQALFLTLWMLWRGFPFLPRISWFRVTHQLFPPATGTWTELWYSMAGFAFLRFFLGPSPWIAVAGAAVLAAPLLEQHTLTLASCVGTLFGWLLGSRPARPKAWAWGLLVVVLVEELRSDHFSGVAGQFGWMPFATWFDGDPNSFYSIIFSKIFVYTACAWAWRNLGSTGSWAPGIPCILLFFAEWAQRYLPGRTPELTDPVLFLAGWVLVQLIGNWRAEAPAGLT